MLMLQQRGNHQYLYDANPILQNGQIVVVYYEDGSQSFVIGNGKDNYRNLPHYKSSDKRKSNLLFGITIVFLLILTIMKLLIVFNNKLLETNDIAILIIITFIELVTISYCWRGKK